MITYNIYDAIIVGGGPAGASCASWLKNLGYSPILIDNREQFGGLQNDSPYPNPWIVSMPQITGTDFAKNIDKQLKLQNIKAINKTKITNIKKKQNGLFEVTTNRNHKIQSKITIVASGVVPKTGGIHPSGNVIIGPGKYILEQDFSKQKVAFLGGGDNAFENFLYLQKKGIESIHIFARSIRARREFTEQVEKKHITLGNYAFSQENLSINDIPYDKIFVMYGWKPKIDFFSPDHTPKLNKNGFIVTNKNRESSISNLYAIGEVTQQTHPCVVTAMSDGVIAAKAIQNFYETNR